MATTSASDGSVVAIMSRGCNCADVDLPILYADNCLVLLRDEWVDQGDGFLGLLDLCGKRFWEVRIGFLGLLDLWGKRFWEVRKMEAREREIGWRDYDFSLLPQFFNPFVVSNEKFSPVSGRGSSCRDESCDVWAMGMSRGPSGTVLCFLGTHEQISRDRREREREREREKGRPVLRSLLRSHPPSPADPANRRNLLLPPSVSLSLSPIRGVVRINKVVASPVRWHAIRDYSLYDLPPRANCLVVAMWKFTSNVISSFGIRKRAPVSPVEYVRSARMMRLLRMLIHGGNLKFPRKNYFLLWMVESLNGDRAKFTSSCSLESQPVSSPKRNLALGNRAGNGSLRRQPSSRNSGQLSQTEMVGRSPDGQHSPFPKSLDIFIDIMSKFPLVIVFLLILFFVLPGCAVILLLYLLLTILFAIPSFLVLYFAYPVLGWLVKEITP
ncbi:hypothetical protein NL676_032286 [Syzygium grande]|nr:hypothetical protein NL676_032286 [Syzygium grande]